MIPEHPDDSGLHTLELFASAPLFNQWLFDAIAPACSGEILEIGSGIGNISGLLLKTGLPVSLSDLQETYCRKLENSFQSYSNLKGIYRIDLADPDLRENHKDLLNQFDTIVALNVIEHIENDDLAIRNCADLLKPSGKLLMLVPAFNTLYNPMDKLLGHYRRYTKRTATALPERSGMKVLSSRYFNVTGIPGWLMTGSVFRKDVIPGWQLHIYNKLVPLFRQIDKPFRHIAGLSVIVVAQKPEINK